MAHLIPPYGHETCAIVLTREEALTLLATLSHNPSAANRGMREVLSTYLDRTQKDD